MNDLFNLFGSSLNDLYKAVQTLKESIANKYEDVSNNVKKYDLSTNEGYEAFIKDSAELRKELAESDMILAAPMVKVLDKIVEYAMNEHKRKEEERNANSVKKDIIRAEVERVAEEKHQAKPSCNCKQKPAEQVNEDIVWPSSGLSERQKRNVWRLVDRYMDEFVIPHLDNEYDDESIERMSSGLFEFAAWLLTTEDED